MKANVQQLIKAQKLLAEALSCARRSMSGNSNVSEAKAHMLQAINKLEKQSKKTQLRKQESQETYNSSFNNVAATTNVATTNFSQEAFGRTLKELDLMINSEKNKLNELEKQVAQQKKPEILND